ncbi:MAG: hypothetical protein A3H59_03325 [Candidatus Jacksonbacteria bacterium RIFCSPLOWO2_02_FULL_43_9]|nr:MAG: hypothetical protein UV70_C0010G0024 [Parcubacteria group bacterium GW2011_GWA2_43_13]OGY68469.1 MAG: hypothetical protein A3B94_02840 [Candidatus Jacksonbacteria bacterium RIFCSPHIGHO2_02_FULL_43_10]OGY70732.1 MAG: hypothetical protein A2986_03100 [Candidatus Jacksonbacteria bacterium RIFCSPLOWO2_01_FULL_44_13]OGY72218.1 MAG: hypothetical protein A3H59_03325 [Candidatus Jacksonbacteria bacterium RIFCSPLOWO2_02_FULL_43_9]HAZ16673.1 hypothetical protein [Candidatus Jacksonbacteria bacter
MTVPSASIVWFWLIEVAPRELSSLWLTLLLSAAGMGIALLILLRSAIAPRIRGPKKRVVRHVGRWLWTWLIIVFFEVFLRQQRTPILSQRIWFILFLLGMGLWAVWIIYIKVVVVPKKERELMYKQ